MTITAKISKLLFEDPICNGRVTADCVEAIAALVQRNAHFVESGAQGSSGVEGRESESAQAMTNPDIKALCERLRAVDSDPIGEGLANNSYHNPDGPEAAISLEVLSARVGELRENMVRMAEPIEALMIAGKPATMSLELFQAFEVAAMIARVMARAALEGRAEG